MFARTSAQCVGIALAACLFLSVAGCPSSDLAGLSIVPSTTGLSGGDALVGPAADGAASDSAANSANPDRPSGSSGGSQLGAAAAAAVQEFSDCGDSNREVEWQDTIMRLVNTERGKAGLGAVRRNATLEAQAGQYACEMIHYDFFDHVNPVTRSTLGQRSTTFGYDYAVVGENLAAGQTSPEQAFTDWMNSPGHRQNILDPRFTELGIGIRTGGDYGVYWVQEFGRPRTAR
jgi:uncharacterized protein YkwD